LGYLPFAQSGRLMLFHLISRLYLCRKAEIVSADRTARIGRNTHDKELILTLLLTLFRAVSLQTRHRTRHSLPPWIMQSFDHQRFWREPAMTSSRTVLIEPNRLFREGLKHLLAGTHYAVEMEFSTTELALEHKDGAMVSGLVITGEVGTEAGDLHRLRDVYPNALIVVLANDLTVETLREAMNAGADGFLMKDVSPEALLQSLELVMLGEKVYPTNLASMLLNLTSAPTPLNSIRGLSPREQEILQALVTGASNKLIAIRLGIAEATVKVHLKTLLRKIDVNNRTQAAIWAMNNGFSTKADVA
jgi:two-component system nitrate/nitrite response regulator NarL